MDVVRIAAGPHRRDRPAGDGAAAGAVDCDGDWLFRGSSSCTRTCSSDAFPRAWRALAGGRRGAGPRCAGRVGRGHHGRRCRGRRLVYGTASDYRSLSLGAAIRAAPGAGRYSGPSHFLHTAAGGWPTAQLLELSRRLSRIPGPADLVHGSHAGAAAVPQRRPVPRNPCRPERGGDRGADRAPEWTSSASHAQGRVRRQCQADRGSSAVRASHDDTTAEHVAEAVACGCRIAEFPTTVEAARAARASGLSIVMGAPNLVLGASHSGNVSAADWSSTVCSTCSPPTTCRRACCTAAFLLTRRLRHRRCRTALAPVTRAPAERCSASTTVAS